MALKIRTVRAEEWDEFMRFLERCYGHSRDYFPRFYPHLYRPDEDALSSFLVLERDGRIVSHVGLYPLEVNCFGASLKVGGIGGVATLLGERGKGHMSRLLKHAAELMKERGWPLSVLWGDRQRYYSFGWEIAGLKYSLTLTKRSLERTNVKAANVREVSAEEAAPLVEKFYDALPLRVQRKHNSLNLRKEGIRIWVSEGGYVVSSGEMGSPRILEVASPEGKEPELIGGVIGRCFGDSAPVEVNAFDEERLGRIHRASSYWTLVPEGQFRMMDLAGLVGSLKGLISKRTKFMRDFELSVGLRLQGDVDATTISVRDDEVEVVKGKGSPNYVELDERAAVPLFLGGPSADSAKLEALATVLPLPVHIPVLDHV